MIDYKVPTKLIGATHRVSLTLPLNVEDYVDIRATLRSKSSDRQVLAQFSKVAVEGFTPIQVDSVNPKRFWCNIDSASTAKAYETTYEMLFKLSVKDDRFASGIKVIPFTIDVINFKG